jgi:hypothetical protein
MTNNYIPFIHSTPRKLPCKKAMRSHVLKKWWHCNSYNYSVYNLCQPDDEFLLSRNTVLNINVVKLTNKNRRADCCSLIFNGLQLFM